MKVMFIFYVINIILMFMARSIFIKTLGANISGLNSLFISLIGFLNVAELGIGIAVGYSLYKPLSEKKYEKINEIMILFREYYKKISKIIAIIGVILAIFLPYLIKGQVDIKLAYLYYFMYLLNCVLSYLFTYKQTLIISDQKQYKIAFILNGTKIIKVLIQCIQLCIIPSFLIWLIIELLFNILGMVLANKKIDKEYKNKITYLSNKSLSQLKLENYIIGRNIKNIFFHKIGSFVVFQTDAIIISLFSTLKETAIYANYMMVVNNLVGLLNNVIGSIMPTIGNLIAEESKEKSYKVFRKLYMLDHLIAIFITIVTFKIIDKFIIFWVGNEYLFSRYIVFAIMINLYIQISRGTVERFKDGFGIYWDIAAPVIESLINLIFSLILAYKFGIMGVFIGTIISNIIIVKLWKPYILFKNGFKKSIKFYIFQTIDIYIRNALIVVISEFIYNKICVYITINNIFISLIIDAFLISFICGIVLFFIYITNSEFRILIKEFLSKILNKNMKRKF